MYHFVIISYSDKERDSQVRLIKGGLFAKILIASMIE